MNKKQQKKLIFWGVVAVVVIGFGALLVNGGGSNGAPGKYTAFAQCLDEKGVKFYGAFWCPHCERQLAAFGTAKDDVPYVECANPDKTQTFACATENIQSYPTWKFPDGTVRTGEQSFDELARLSGCELPS